MAFSEISKGENERVRLLTALKLQKYTFKPSEGWMLIV